MTQPIWLDKMYNAVHFNLWKNKIDQFNIQNLTKIQTINLRNNELKTIDFSLLPESVT